MNPADEGIVPIKKILILYAHPAQRHSEVNVPLAASAASSPAVTLVDLYADYPTLEIDVTVEQQRLIEHDIIVFLHPLYWHSTPAILKEWQDLVLEYGFAYGKDGNALKNKLFFSAMTMGGKRSDYQKDGYNEHSVRELLYPIEMTMKQCQMRYLPPFVLYDARRAVSQNRLEPHRQAFVKLIEALRDNRLDIPHAKTLPTLNGWRNGTTNS